MIDQNSRRFRRYTIILLVIAPLVLVLERCGLLPIQLTSRPQAAQSRD